MIRWHTDRGPRYYVLETPGYRITQIAGAGAGRGNQPIAFTVIDRDWNHEEMANYWPHEHGVSTKRCRDLAYERCDELNEIEREAAREGCTSSDLHPAPRSGSRKVLQKG